MRCSGFGACAAASFLLFGACGGGGGGPAGSADGGGGGGGGADADVDADGFQTLMTGDWELPPGSEAYFCVRKTIQQELYIGGFEAIAPVGTHHTVVTVGAPSGPDGLTKCTTFENHNAMIFGSGVGTNPVEFPDGVAMRIAPGQQVLLNLHVYNVSDQTLTGTSGTRIKRMDPGDVDEVAEALLMGPIQSLKIPPGESTQTGSCVMDSDVNLFAVGPHMHTLGTHMKVVAQSSVMGDTVVHDGDYDFDNQLLHLIDPVVPMSQGDRVQVSCTYVNPGTSDVYWGESTDDEMCFAGVYRYPASGANFICGF